MRPLETNPKVALTIDTNTFPSHTLLVRGRASVEIVDGVPPEYLNAAKKYVGALQWQTFEAQVRAMYKRMARITIVPEWAKLFGLTRIPSAVERLAKQGCSQPPVWEIRLLLARTHTEQLNPFTVIWTRQN